MAQPSVESKEEKDKRKKRGIFILLAFFLSISLLLVSVLLSPTPTTSSSAASSVTSSASITSSLDASSSSPDSSVTPSSSEVTTTSSTPTSSEIPSSSTSSEPLDGPRLSLLTNLDQIRYALKNGAYEYFIWEDDTSYYVSAFLANTLLDTTTLVSKTGNFFSQEVTVAFDDGILFTFSGFDGVNLSNTTYFYTFEGIQSTLSNTALILAGGSFAEDNGVYAVKLVDDTPELHFISEPSLTSTKQLDLNPSYAAYNSITDQFQVTSTRTVDLQGSMYIISAVNFANNFENTIMVFNTANDELVYEGPLFNQNTQTTITRSNVFVSTPQTMTVTHYPVSGGFSPFLQSMMTSLEAFNAVIIDERINPGQPSTYVYVDGQENPYYFDGQSIYVFESTVDEGLAFATIKADQSAFTLHAYEDGGLTSTEEFPYSPELFNRNFAMQSNGAIRYQTQDGSSNTITHYIHYDQGWKYSEVFGELPGFGNALISINDVPYLVDIPEVTSSNRDALTITVHHGGQNTNTSLPIVLENLDLLSVQIVGFVDEYMIVNLNYDTTRTSQGYVINLLTGTYEPLPESIWYLAPNINESYTPYIFNNNNVISVYGGFGGISFDINDIDNSFTSYASNLLAETHQTWLSIVENHFEDGDDAVVLFEFLNNNPLDVAELTVMKGDMTLGLPNLTVLTTVEVEEIFLNQHELLITETGVLGYNPFSNSIVTLLGDELSGSFYVQNGLLILLAPDLTETITTISMTDFIRLY